MLRADVINAAAPQTTSLSDKDWVHLRGFHIRQGWRLYYEALFLLVVSQYHDFDTFSPMLLSSQSSTPSLASKSTT